MDIDLSTLPKGQVYRLMIQTIVPRPVAWVLSDNGDGGFNLAPFSYFNGITSDPPIVMISVGHKRDGSKKDTWRNIEERDDFVVHITPTDLAPAMTATSASLPHGESELDASGLETTDLAGFRLPRIIGPRIAFGCRKHQIVEVGAAKQGVIFGEIVRTWIDDDIVSADAKGILVDAKKLDPLARLGGNDYGSLGEVFTVDRPE
jgi:flavin reductase (DIM6/NTAB) family NADH-FMN oxidoreductase RutF